MASPQNSKVRKTYLPFSNQITVNSLRMSSQDIEAWRTAINAARNELNPRRKLLYELYDNIKIDGHLLSVMNKRRLAITNKKVSYHERDKEGVVFDNVQDLITHAPWFYDFLSLAMDQIAFGHSLVELIPEAGIICKVKLIPRANVVPEKGLALFNQNNLNEGISYRIDPLYSRYLIEVGGEKDYGDLMTAAQYVIYKRGGFGDWAQFAEIFGMPFRVGKYNPFDEETRKKLDLALREMGGAGHITIPHGSDINFHDTNSSGKSEIYKDMINLCNSEMSKIFLGQTMTTDNGSSRSQSEVHKEVEEDINLSDMIRIEYILNWDFKTKLAQIGYPIANGNFRFPQTRQIPLEKRIEIDMKVSEQVEIEEEYWYTTYGVPKPDGSQKPVKVDPVKKEDPSKKKEPLNVNNLDAFYRPIISAICPDCFPEAKGKISEGPDKIMDRIARGIHSGKIKPGSVDPKLYKWIAGKLFEGVTEGFGGDFTLFDPETPDYEMLANLEKNVHVFSAFKTYHELREATNLLTDADGKIRSFGDFKADILLLNEKYNVSWLNHEYNLAVASSQMASIWIDFQNNKETLPNAKYHTVGDDRVRYQHKVLDEFTAPVDDPIWNTIFPPNGWGCRCDVTQEDDSVRLSDPKKIDIETIPPMFRVNTAKKGIVFPEKHPYFKVFKEDKKQADKLWDLAIPDKNKNK